MMLFNRLRQILLVLLTLSLFVLSLYYSTAAQDCGDGYGYQNCTVESFSDVVNYQFGSAVQYVRNQGIVQGYEDGTFRPNASINRAEFTKILMEAVLPNAIDEPQNNCFSDVPSQQWFAVYVCSAQREGLITGYPDGSFQPVNAVNFAEAAKILLSAYEINSRSLRNGEQWFEPFVEALSDLQAIPGTISDTTHQLTRGEMAELIMRLEENLRNRPSLSACDLVSSLCRTYQALDDVSQHPRANSIEFLLRRNIVDGYDDGTFRPWDPINRAEMLKILLEAKLANASIAPNSHCFSDVGNEWFAAYVCYAKDNGIVKGYPDGSFHPGESVNMVEALKMALETFDVPVAAATADEQWFQPYIAFAHNSNLFSRFSYVPTKLINRGDMAWLIHQLTLNDAALQLLAKVRDNRSAGCGRVPPGVPPTASTINGVYQNYITDVPGSYNKDVPIALTFAWHGRTNSNSRVRTYYKVYEAAEGETIMVYPAGTGPWNLDRDVALFDQLLAEFSENYCIDLDRIYVLGHSLGAWFTNSLACLRGDVIRASGSLGGGTTQTACAGPVAAITMHNPADRLSPFSQGVAARDVHLAQNACGQATLPYDSPAQARCQMYSECAPDQPVVWCPHTEDYSWGYYYPHGWPRWTGAEIWEFFASLN